MFDTLRKSWQELKRDKPGERFQNRFERAKGKPAAGRIAKTILGFVLTAAGIVFLPLPGPGSVVILIGIALLAEQSRKVASALDRIEVWARERIRAVRSR